MVVNQRKINKNTSDYKVAVIGAGASGLSVAYELQKLGFNVDIYEKSSRLGGIAGALELSKGKIDSFYHHLFKSDNFILDFLKDNNIPVNVIFKRTKTGHIWNNKYFDISNILSIRKSGLLSNYGFIRLLIGGAIIKYFPTNKTLNKKLVISLSKKLFGEEAALRIWDPLLNFKFGKYAKYMPYSWLRARIKDRTIELGYVSQGFETIYDYLANQIKSKKGNVFTNVSIKKIKFNANKEKLIINGKTYDRAVLTTSPKVNNKILKDIKYRSKPIKYLGAICGVIEFDKKPIPSYWLGIADTNKLNKSNYKNFLAAISYAELDDEWNKSGTPTWPLYLASYCTEKQFLNYSCDEWREKMINAAFELNKLSSLENIDKSNIINFDLSFAEYAQPILSPGKKLVPDPEKAKFCYFSNMHNIFPNDRGQNRSFYLGKTISKQIYNDLIKDDLKI